MQTSTNAPAKHQRQQGEASTAANALKHDSNMAARNRPGPPTGIQLGTKAREHIHAYILIKRLEAFALIDPDNPKPGDVRMTRSQAFVALALLRKVLPDLASVEVSGNQEKPLLVQVVRFSDGKASEPRPILDMGKLIEIERSERAEMEAEVGDKVGERKNGHAT
jgi:hypothetical protein